MTFDPAEPELFEQIYFDVLGLSPRNFPSEVEWSELRSNAGRHALLLSSPEPIDWARVDITTAIRTRVRVGPNVNVVTLPVETAWIRHADKSKALVFFPSGGDATGPLPVGRLRIKYTYRRDAGAALPLLTVLGDSTSETVTQVLTLPASGRS
jgi:hypothetical protein